MAKLSSQETKISAPETGLGIAITVQDNTRATVSSQQVETEPEQKSNRKENDAAVADLVSHANKEHQKLTTYSFEWNLAEPETDLQREFYESVDFCEIFKQRCDGLYGNGNVRLSGIFQELVRFVKTEQPVSRIALFQSHIWPKVPRSISAAVNTLTQIRNLLKICEKSFKELGSPGRCMPKHFTSELAAEFWNKLPCNERAFHTMLGSIGTDMEYRPEAENDEKQRTARTNERFEVLRTSIRESIDQKFQELAAKDAAAKRNERGKMSLGANKVPVAIRTIVQLIAFVASSVALYHFDGESIKAETGDAVATITLWTTRFVALAVITSTFTNLYVDYQFFEGRLHAKCQANRCCALTIIKGLYALAFVQKMQDLHDAWCGQFALSGAADSEKEA